MADVLHRDADHPTLIKEFVLLFVLLPALIISFRWAQYLFPFLWAATAYCAVVYRKDYFISWRKLWNFDAVKWETLQYVILRWLIVSLIMFVFIYFYDPAQTFAIIRERPEIIPFIFVFYPLLSALPQEFIFCSFFFKRFAPLFPKRNDLILMSALTFAVAHMLFINPVAPIFSFFGGLIFALVYSKYRSLALVTIEHSLYGLSLFLIGLGWYFWTGSVH